ncbi:MAG: hypothetical protein AAB486_04240 [Patescibacteria group bacterium]
MVKSNPQSISKKELQKELAGLEKKIDNMLSYTGNVKRYLEGEINAQSKLLGIRVDTSILAAERRINEQAKQYRDQILNTFDKYLSVPVIDKRVSSH